MYTGLTLWHALSLRHRRALASVLACLSLSCVQAGVFDDEDARRQIKDLTTQVNQRLEAMTQAQFDLTNQMQALRDENARLRGQIETLNYELAASKKREQDFYVDLDGRLRTLEEIPASSAGKSTTKAAAEKSASNAEGAHEAKASGDAAVEAREYEAALNLFKTNKLKEATSAFDVFVKKYPDSSLAPNAQYWLGNAYFAANNCKKAIEAHKLILTKWPQHAKAPDALLNMASCQQELGETKAAKTSLETIIAKYPASTAATTAKQRLKK